LSDHNRYKPNKIIGTSEALDEDNYGENDEKSCDDDAYMSMEDILAPQEKFLLRSDPWNQNFLVSTWTNDATLLLPRGTPHNNSNYQGSHCNGELISDIWRLILGYYNVIEIARFSIISRWHKYFYDTIPIQIWKDYFKNQNWRLPHQILNNNVEPHQHQIFINENKVDWFGEVKRNYLNDTRISELIKE